MIIIYVFSVVFAISGWETQEKQLRPAKIMMAVGCITSFYAGPFGTKLNGKIEDSIRIDWKAPTLCEASLYALHRCHIFWNPNFQSISTDQRFEKCNRAFKDQRIGNNKNIQYRSSPDTVIDSKDDSSDGLSLTLSLPIVTKCNNNLNCCLIEHKILIGNGSQENSKSWQEITTFFVC